MFGIIRTIDVIMTMNISCNNGFLTVSLKPLIQEAQPQPRIPDGNPWLGSVASLRARLHRPSGSVGRVDVQRRLIDSAWMPDDGPMYATTRSPTDAFPLRTVAAFVSIRVSLPVKSLMTYELPSIRMISP